MHEGLLHTAHPVIGYVLFVAALIVHRHDFVFQYGIDRPGMNLVLVLGVVLTVADGPAARDFVSLIEPAIQDAEIQDAVHSRFHTAGTASLFAAPGRIEPKVDALDQLTADAQA